MLLILKLHTNYVFHELFLSLIGSFTMYSVETTDEREDLLNRDRLPGSYGTTSGIYIVNNVF